MRRVVSVSPGDGFYEPDHSEDELKSLRRFLRVINPDPLKYLSDLYRKEARAQAKK